MPAHPYLSSITSLRGIAALLVVIFHIDGIWIHMAPKASGFFLHQCYLMVDFFFILSGFILVHVYGASFGEGVGLFTYKRFIRHRFARIYPLHLFAFLCMYVFYRVQYAGKSLDGFEALLYNKAAIFTNLTLLHSMGLHSFFSWNVPSWSISTEWWMYVLFPWLYVWLKPGSKQKTVLVFAGIAVGYVAITYLLYPIEAAASPVGQNRGYSLDVTYRFGFIRCFVGCVLGMQLYSVFQKGWFKAMGQQGWPLAVVVLLLVLLMHFGLPDYLVVVCFALVLMLSVHSTGLAHRMLHWSPLQLLGRVSYSLYLMHGPVLIIGLAVLKHYMPGIAYQQTSLHSIAWVLGFLLLLFFISYLTYRGIEQPLRNGLGGRRPMAGQS